MTYMVPSNTLTLVLGIMKLTNCVNRSLVMHYKYNILSLFDLCPGIQKKVVFLIHQYYTFKIKILTLRGEGVGVIKNKK